MMKFSYLTFCLPTQVEEGKHSTTQKMPPNMSLICQIVHTN